VITVFVTIIFVNIDETTLRIERSLVVYVLRLLVKSVVHKVGLYLKFIFGRFQCFYLTELLLYKGGLKLDKDYIKTFRKVQLELTKFIHDLCEKNNITYFLIGGTLLGAVRHGGFIPWDDDVDIGMPRPDYEKFLNILKREKLKSISILHYKKVQEYPSPFLKIFDNRTKIIDKTYSHLNFPLGVYVDIFPFDGAPDGIVHRIIHYLLARFYKKLALAFYCNISCVKQGNLLRRVKNGIFMLFLKPFFKTFQIKGKDILDMLERHVKKFDFYSSNFVCNYYGAWGWKEMVPKDFLIPPSKIRFENQELLCVAKPKDYLAAIYDKDFMIPPPIDQRRGHNIEIIKIDYPH